MVKIKRTYHGQTHSDGQQMKLTKMENQHVHRLASVVRGQKSDRRQFSITVYLPQKRLGPSYKWCLKVNTKIQNIETKCRHPKNRKIC